MHVILSKQDCCENKKYIISEAFNLSSMTESRGRMSLIEAEKALSEAE
jgi:hypothetical protein